MDVWAVIWRWGGNRWVTHSVASISRDMLLLVQSGEAYWVGFPVQSYHVADCIGNF